MESQVVLLVEDNADDVELTLRSFQKHDLPSKIINAGNGIEALDYLFSTGRYAGRPEAEMPSLILLDLKLPKMDGFEVLRRIRSEDSTRHIPVVILTTSSESQDRFESYRLGANSYIRKPMNFDHFMETVRQLGTYWLTLNHLAPAEPVPQNQGAGVD